MNRRVAVRAIIAHEGELLCAKLFNSDKTGSADYWSTIGGGVDPGEALVPALHREVIEETGIEPKIGSLLFVQQFKSETTESLEFFFHVTNGEDFLNIDLSKTTHGEAEIAEIGFIDTSKETVLPEFLSQEHFTNLEQNQTKFFNYL